MRVVIDATPLLVRSAGVKTYVFQWLTHLRRLAGDDAIGAFPFLRSLGECLHEGSALPRAQTAVRLGVLAAVNFTRLPLLDCLPWRADVFHASQLLRNPPRRSRLTATLYDMTCWVAPETHTQENVAGTKEFAERVLKRADGLIAISESARDDAVRILSLPERKFEVLYPGVSDSFFEAPAGDTGVAARYGISRPYVLFVGTIEPRKNVDTLVDAWARMSPSLREQFEIVCAGPAGWAAERILARLRGGEAGIRYLGYVPEADLPGLTAGASLFVYPSLYEGFGLPPAQAMAAGVPVVSSNTSSLPEVVGDAGILIDPLSADELRSAIERLLLSPGTRAALASKGRERARRFTWEAHARGSLRFFERVCGL